MKEIILWVIGMAIYIGLMFLFLEIRNRHRGTEYGVRFERAVALGHTVKAHRVYYDWQYEDGVRSRRVITEARYEYSLGGRTYGYLIMSTRGDPPDEITLYWLDDQSRMFSTYDKDVISDMLVLFVPLVIAILVAGTISKIFI